ncbi:HBL206Cp [Eremothecium sinecaudum]|uniref:HBL206Cp n=1 Tax=Eremothecium sinecaudum TaxID=45286 RepID=A0A125RDV5_9SACH|nr:HBL206Cp [Eremothecium sinecaudum]AMD18696.1 HBL206Cp [Eremothecium sinecaudum]
MEHLKSERDQRLRSPGRAMSDAERRAEFGTSDGRIEDSRQGSTQRPVAETASRVPRISLLLCDPIAEAVSVNPMVERLENSLEPAFVYRSKRLIHFHECYPQCEYNNRGARYALSKEEQPAEKKQKKNVKRPEDVRFRGGFLRKTMFRHYDTEILKYSLKRTSAIDKFPKFEQVLRDVREIIVNYEIMSINALGPYLDGKAQSLGDDVKHFRTIIALKKEQRENHVSLVFGVNPDDVKDKKDVFHFSIISRKCEHNDAAANLTKGWLHLVANYELALLLEFIFGDIDENIWANDELLSSEVANDPKKRYQSRMRSRYKGAIFITVYTSRKLNKEAPGFSEVDGEDDASPDSPSVSSINSKMKVKCKTLRLKAALYDQMLSYRIGITGQPSHSLVKADKLKWIIEHSLAAYSWVNPAKAPIGGYIRLF